MRTYLCTLDEAKREIRAKETFDDNAVFALIGPLSERFVKLTGLEFEPIRETRTIPVSAQVVSTWARTLALGEYILELESVTVNGSAQVVDTDVKLVIASPPTDPPRVLQALASQAVLQYGAEVEVTGWWGYRSRWQQRGWTDTTDRITNSGGINATVATLTVNDADGIDEQGLTPRFSRGQLLRVDDEMLRVLAVESGSNTLTVRRGVRGTEAAAHAQNAALLTWSAEEDVVWAMTKWVALMYQRRAVFDTKIVDGIGAVSTPADTPSNVYAVAQRYAHK